MVSDTTVSVTGTDAVSETYDATGTDGAIETEDVTGVVDVTGSVSGNEENTVIEAGAVMGTKSPRLLLWP
jgi:hypothetical protein